MTTAARRKPEVLRIRQASMQLQDSVVDIREDLIKVLPRIPQIERRVGATVGYDDPDWVCFTEAPPESRVQRQIINRCGEAGYQPVFFDEGDIMFAVHFAHRVFARGYVQVLEPNLGMEKGNYGSRGVGFVGIVTPEGNRVWAHGQHWLTAWQLDRQKGPESPREVKIMAQTEQQIELMKLHGRSTAISFGQGDTNVDENKDTGFDPDAVHAAFKRAGIVSCFDEVGRQGEKRFPGTHGSKRGPTYDVIFRSLADTRSSFLDYEVHPKGNSDHLMVDAVARITPLRGR